MKLADKVVNPLETFEPQNPEERAQVRHIETMMDNLKIACRHLDRMVAERKKPSK